MNLAPVERGYRSPEVCRIAGVTYRQLDHLCRTAGLEPSIADAAGSGSARLFSRDDVARVLLWATLVHAGVGHVCARHALIAAAENDWSSVQPGEAVTLFADGTLHRGALVVRGLAAQVVWPEWDRLDDPALRGGSVLGSRVFP